MTGKAWESLAFGFQNAMSVEAALFANIAGEWQLIACAFAMVHSVWVLKTQRLHGDAHSAHCVCTVCAPEYYRVGVSDTSLSNTNDAVEIGEELEVV